MDGWLAVPELMLLSEGNALEFSVFTLFATNRFHAPCDSLEGRLECIGEQLAVSEERMSSSSSDTSQSSYASLEHTREMSVLFDWIDIILGLLTSFFSPFPSFLSTSAIVSSVSSGAVFALRRADIIKFLDLLKVSWTKFLSYSSVSSSFL